MATALGKVCAACGRERKKGIVYHPVTFMPYCDNPYTCSPDHPNSPENLIERGYQQEFLDYDEADTRFKEFLKLNYDPTKAEKIRRLVLNPFTVRIGSHELAEFLLQLQDELGIPTTSEAVRWCIERVKEDRDRYQAQYTELKDTKEVETALNRPKTPEPEPQQTPEPADEETEDDEVYTL